MLVWARERAKVTAEAAAKAVNVKPETLAEWEAGAETPTLNQLRALATCYRFPLAVFYLPKPPKDFAPLRDFRRLPDAGSEEIIKLTHYRDTTPISLKGEGNDAKYLKNLVTDRSKIHSRR